jgi:uncharacterized protein YutE (UPF0331/DUF86 family)
MTEYRYAKGRILESIQYITNEMKEFNDDYADKEWGEYQNDTKLQKLMDRTVENILTALIEICGTVLTEQGIAVESYGDGLKKCAKFFGLSKKQQENLARLAIQRNRLAHRYLNFRWQAVQMFSEQEHLVSKLLRKILEREEKK